MIGVLRHFVRRKLSEHRERKKDATRSPEWRRVKNEHLKTHPFCAGCGGQKHLQVHHILPFHLHPELELNPSNLVTACMSARECHLLVSHGDDFKKWNPNVVEDLAELLAAPGRREMIVARAKANRRT